jgi:hypothetical protein
MAILAIKFLETCGFKRFILKGGSIALAHMSYAGE